jgi:hypothetical protein
MAETKHKQEETVQEENPQEVQTQTSGIPDYKSDRDEVRQTSQHFLRSLFRAGFHLAMAPVYVLPEEPREHFFSAGREFSRGLSSLAQEIADDFDKLVKREKEEAGE